MIVANFAGGLKRALTSLDHGEKPPTEEEAIHTIRSGLFQPMGGDSPFISLSSEAALRTTVGVPKLFGDSGWDLNMDEASALFARFQSTAERGILALRLTTSDQVVAPGYHLLTPLTMDRHFTFTAAASAPGIHV